MHEKFAFSCVDFLQIQSAFWYTRGHKVHSMDRVVLLLGYHLATWQYCLANDCCFTLCGH